LLCLGVEMNQICFKHLDKLEFENILPRMFAILHANMSVIAPTGNSYESDFQIWVSHILPVLNAKSRETILFYVNGELVGYFRYFLDENMQLLFEDIQIESKFQGMGIFSSCLKWLVNRLPKNILGVEAYVDKRNNRSRAILEHFGLKCKGENKNGISLYLTGDYSDFYNKFC